MTNITENGQSDDGCGGQIIARLLNRLAQLIDVYEVWIDRDERRD